MIGSVRAKALLLFSITLGFGVLALVMIMRTFLLDSFVRSETEQMEQELGHVKAHLAYLLNDLSEYTAEYSAWNDTWEFLAGEHPEYFSENFTFVANAYRKLNIVALLDPAGRLVAGTAYDPASATYAPLPTEFLAVLRAHPSLHRHAGTGDMVAGLLELGGHPMLLVSRPVVRNNFIGPIRGAILFGEFIGEASLRRLGGARDDPPLFYALDAPDLPRDVREAVGALRGGAIQHIRRPNDQQADGYALLPDFTGRPAFALRVRLAREIYRNGLMSIRVLLAAFAVVVLVTGTVYVVLLDRTVIRRVVALGAAVEEVRGGGDPAGTLRDRGNDELGRLTERVREAFVEERRLIAEVEQSARELEARVGERTRELRGTVDALAAEVADRRAAEERVRGLEQRQRVVFENMAAGLVTFDEELNVTAMNQAAQRLLRAAPGLVGRPLGRVLPADLAGAVVAAFGRPESPGAAGELAIPQGMEARRTVAWVLTQSAPGAGGGRQGILLLQDRTEELRLAAEQQRLNRLSVLGRLSAQLAHELRNPLTAMSSTVQYLEGGGAGDRELLGILREGIDQMDGILNRIRMLSREMPLARTPVDLGDLVARLLRLLDQALRAAGIEPVFRPPARPLVVMADQAQLQQALLNILMNAKQAMPGGGRLRVRLARGRPGRAMILVADGGSGIDPEVAGRIFDPFYTTRETGTGLGLPIADRIVRDHGGGIRFTSRPGHGSCFVVILPAAEEGEACQAS